jgi:L-ornithine Nalpha-acyltransferase
MGAIMANASLNDDVTDELRAGNLEVRLAVDAADVDAAQDLRYRVFYEEMSAAPNAAMAARRRDFDRFDEICDHLLVIDHGGDRAGRDGGVVGTYRMLRRSVAARHGGFYTAGEYDIAALLAQDGELLEVGRSCVDEAYRNRATIQLLFRGIAAYVEHHGVALIFGCASLPGIDPAAMAMALSYLAHNHLAPPALRPVALAEHYVNMKLLAPEAVVTRAAIAALPPMIKGYIRAGCVVGDGAVIDRQFGTVDVCIVVPMDRVSKKFRQRYEHGASAPAGD